MKKRKYIPVASPDLSALEKEYLNDAFDSSWISSKGKYLDQFEESFARLCEVKHAIAVSNGTVALHLALLAMDVRPGDEIIVPSLTYIATANAVRYVGAEPIFVDVDPLNWCLDPALIENAISRKTKGIIAVDLYGHPSDYDAINKIAAVHGLWVIEDAAEAHTATYKGKPTGGLAKVGTFSFYGNKIFTSGEGGMITLNDDALAARIRILRGQGMDPDRRYFFPVVGYNFRLTNLAAAIACAQLERKDEILKKRNLVYTTYEKALAKVKGIQLQPSSIWADVAPWFFSITIDSKKFGNTRDDLIKILQEAGIETRPFFIPIHKLPPYRKESKKRGDVLPVTDRLSESGLNLPTSGDLSQDDIAYICGTILGARNK